MSRPFNHFFVISDGKFYTIDDTTGAIKSSGSFAADPQPAAQRSWPASYWADFAEVSLEDGSHHSHRQRERLGRRNDRRR
jgi:hypothetical protein